MISPFLNQFLTSSIRPSLTLFILHSSFQSFSFLHSSLLTLVYSSCTHYPQFILIHNLSSSLHSYFKFSRSRHSSLLLSFHFCSVCFRSFFLSSFSVNSTSHNKCSFLSSGIRTFAHYFGFAFCFLRVNSHWKCTIVNLRASPLTSMV
jgi:hypothetical protein